MSDVQEFLDTYYHKSGACCAGCDWWHHLNSKVGECHKTAPVAADAERTAMLGIAGLSLHGQGAGHVMTAREHFCGSFKDEFDWSSLPLGYQKRIGRALRA